MTNIGCPFIDTKKKKKIGAPPTMENTTRDEKKPFWPKSSLELLLLGFQFH
jgi:hypothetical protein